MGLVIHALESAAAEDEISQFSAPQVKEAEVAQPAPLAAARKPKGGLMEKVKSWFEDQIQSSSNYIE